MSATERLVSQHIKEYESRLKHIDELFHRAQAASAKLADDHAIKYELETYQRQKAELAKQAEQLKRMEPENWREETIQASGPMAVWDILAQQLEDVIERLE